LEIEDKLLAFQLDSALAAQGEMRDLEVKRNFVEAINEHILLVCKSLGAKIRKTAPAPKMIDREPRPLNEVLTQLGGKGVVIERKKE